jgi:hypothetical protein
MSYLSEQDADTPLSRWQFEEAAGPTIDDDKTATRDGTITGTVTLNQPAVFNDGGLGATFDGASGFVTMGNMNGLLGIGTVEAIVQFNSIPATQVAVFTHQFAGSILPMVIGFNLDSSHTSQLQVGYFTGSVWQTATFAAVTTGIPYHIVGKYDGTTVKMRVNGVQVDSTTVSTVRPGAGTVLANAYIGKNWNSNVFLSGKVYDVAIYAAALSDARCDAHYAALGNGFADNFASAKPVFLVSTPALGHWKAPNPAQCSKRAGPPLRRQPPTSTSSARWDLITTPYWRCIPAPRLTTWCSSAPTTIAAAAARRCCVYRSPAPHSTSSSWVRPLTGPAVWLPSLYVR